MLMILVSMSLIMTMSRNKGRIHSGKISIEFLDRS